VLISIRAFPPTHAAMLYTPVAFCQRGAMGIVDRSNSTGRQYLQPRRLAFYAELWKMRSDVCCRCGLIDMLLAPPGSLAPLRIFRMTCPHCPSGHLNSGRGSAALSGAPAA